MKTIKIKDLVLNKRYEFTTKASKSETNILIIENITDNMVTYSITSKTHYKEYWKEIEALQRIMDDRGFYIVNK